MSKTDDAPTGVTEDAFDFLEWLESGTIARRQVVIYNDHEAFEVFVKVDERLDRSKATWTVRAISQPEIESTCSSCRAP